MSTGQKNRAEGGISNLEPQNEVPFLANLLSLITERLKQQHSYSDEDIFALSKQDKQILVPAAIFAGKLSPSEALAKFLKENHGLSYREIASMTGRDERSIWANYRRAARKMPSPFEIGEGVSVPLSAFVPENSILKSLLHYLKDVRKMRNKKIAQLLNKHPANIWTVLNRASKRGKPDE